MSLTTPSPIHRRWGPPDHRRGGAGTGTARSTRSAGFARPGRPTRPGRAAGTGEPGRAGRAARTGGPTRAGGSAGAAALAVRGGGDRSVAGRPHRPARRPRTGGPDGRDGQGLGGGRHRLAGARARGRPALRGLHASWEPTEDQRHEVRTSYATTLAPLAGTWLCGTAKRPPAGLHLNGRRLRLWVAAAGSPEPPGFLLRLGETEESCWEAVGAALAAIGLPAVLLLPRAGGPAYRITGRRRLARLVELVGERPAAAPAAIWPALAV